MSPRWSRGITLGSITPLLLCHPSLPPSRAFCLSMTRWPRSIMTLSCRPCPTTSTMTKTRSRSSGWSRTRNRWSVQHKHTHTHTHTTSHTKAHPVHTPAHTRTLTDSRKQAQTHTDELPLSEAAPEPPRPLTPPGWLLVAGYFPQSWHCRMAKSTTTTTSPSSTTIPASGGSILAWFPFPTSSSIYWAVFLPAV